MIRHRTVQQSDPHPQLVAARNAIQATGKSRLEAALICDQLSHAEVELIVSDGEAAVALALDRLASDARPKRRR